MSRKDIVSGPMLIFAIIKKFLRSAAIASAALLVAPANAAVVNFNAPANNSTQNITFAEGVFSTNLGPYADGFYTLDNTTAYNGYGQDGEYILFDSAVMLNSLVLDDYASSFDSTSVTVSLFDSSAALIASQIWNNFGIAQTLTFDTSDVSKVLFNITSPTSTDPYGGGRTNVSFYQVGDITYNVAAVPEPSTYAMLLAGLGLMGFVARRRMQDTLAG